MVLKVATRGSKLALKQTDIAIAYLKKYLKDIDFEIVIIKTHGDKDQTSALYNMQTNGVFVKDVEEALVCHQADIAVHSLKDVSSTLHEGLMLLPHLIFENKQDCLITKN
ncbi:MAG: hydroxymethylbilane synthase, partial [Erysipelotrichaceae bacterium]|nr:hydroxymethylbilane synthase [Erysipelotrichaceae bacterium]